MAFDLLDYNSDVAVGDPDHINKLLLDPNIHVSRSGPPVLYVAGDEVVVASADNIETSFYLDAVAIPQRFTFQMTLRPDSLPPGLQETDKSLIFIAVFDQQDNAGGLLLSKEGIAVVSAVGNVVLPLAGSQSLILEGTDAYVVRMVVDGVQNRMDLYVTKESELATVGHQLRYTAVAPSSPTAAIDSVRVEIIGQHQGDVGIRLRALQVGTGMQVPNKRPVATTGQDQTAAIGNVIEMDGSGSQDPEGEELTYLWSLIGCPDGSSYRIQGTGATAAGVGFTDTLEDATGPWSLAKAPDLQPGDVLVVSGVRSAISAVDWVYNATTKKYDRDVTFLPTKIKTVTATIPVGTGLAWSIYHQSIFFFDRTIPKPSWVPDEAGLYTVQLVVNDGSLDSLPAEGLVNVSDHNVPLGFVPDVSFLWNYLSDFWGLVEDREVFETVWGGMAQATTALLMTAWQVDYGKSLRDIQRTFQRRWIHYDTEVEEPAADIADQEISFLRGPIVGLLDHAPLPGVAVNGKTLLIERDTDPITITFSGADPIPSTDIVRQINEGTGTALMQNKTAALVTEGASTYLTLNHHSSRLLVLKKGGTANTALGFSTTEDTANHLQGAAAQIPGPTQDKLIDVSDPAVDLTGTALDTILAFNNTGHRVRRSVGSKSLELQDSVTTVDAGAWELSSTVSVPNTDFGEELVRPGDIAYFEVQGPTGPPVEVACRVTGAAGKVLGFNPVPLLSVLHPGGTYEVYYLRVRRCTNIAVDALVVRVPRLQEIVLDPPVVLTLNRDYSIAKVGTVNAITFGTGTFDLQNPPPKQFWAEVTYLDNRPTIADNFGEAVGLPLDHFEEQTSNLDYLSSVRGMWYAFFHGPTLFNMRLGVQVLLGLPFAEVAGTIRDINTTFNAQYMRVLIADDEDSSVVRSYFVPRSPVWESDEETMLAVNPSTGVEYVAGDSVEQFRPLSKGVELLDWVKDATWWKPYCLQGAFHELKKFFRFLVRADVDVFSVPNMLFAQSFIHQIRPGHSYPLLVVLKRLPPDEIDTVDALTFFGIQKLYDDPLCSTDGSYRFDDIDGLGNPNWAFDAGLPAGPPAARAFLFDKRRLCPPTYISAYMFGVHAGGLFPFDWFWAFDNGGTFDELPLSGPDSSPPAPYGPAVGTVKFDTSYPAGTYHRIKKLYGSP